MTAEALVGLVDDSTGLKLLLDFTKLKRETTQVRSGTVWSWNRWSVCICWYLGIGSHCGHGISSNQYVRLLPFDFVGMN